MQANTISYDVLTDDEMNQERGVLQPSVYPAEIILGTPKVSKTSGNQMAELKVKAWDDAGRQHILIDYIVFTRKMAWKVKHFWESVGKPEKYNGAFDCAEVAGLPCFITTDLEEDQKGIPRAKIKDYITEEEYKKEKADEAIVNSKMAAIDSKLSKANDELDDDIPF